MRTRPYRAAVPWPTTGLNPAGIENPRWNRKAACRLADPELFFPERGGNAEVAAAKKWCRQCPVQADCLQYALANREQHGVWGGCTERERNKLLAGRPKTQTIHADRTAQQYYALLDKGVDKFKARKQLNLTEYTARRYEQARSKSAAEEAA